MFSPSISSPSSSPVENIKQGCDVGAAKASCPPSTKETADFKDNSCISKDESCWDSCDSDDPSAGNAAGGAEECKSTKRSRVNLKQVDNMASAAYPEPRLPYPCMSSLSSKDQQTYLGILMSKKPRDPPQVPYSLFNGILILPVLVALRLQ